MTEFGKSLDPFPPFVSASNPLGGTQGFRSFFRLHYTSEANPESTFYRAKARHVRAPGKQKISAPQRLLFQCGWRKKSDTEEAPPSGHNVQNPRFTVKEKQGFVFTSIFLFNFHRKVPLLTVNRVKQTTNDRTGPDPISGTILPQSEPFSEFTAQPNDHKVSTYGPTLPITFSFICIISYGHPTSKSALYLLKIKWTCAVNLILC